MKTLVKQAFDRTLGVVLAHPHTTFFMVLAVLVSAPMAGWVCDIVLDDLHLPKVVGVVSMYLSLLGVLVVALNLGESDATAKEIFWLWIILSIVLTLFVGLGNLEIMLFKWVLF